MKNHRIHKRVFFLILLLCILVGIPQRHLTAEMETDQAQKRVEQSIEIRQATQKAEDKWAEERERLKAEYEELEGEYDRLSAEKRELEAETAARRASVEAIEKEIAQVARISNELTPFLEQTYDRLAALVKEDVPFLRDERKRRLETLRQTMDDPLISAGEKYRKVMEALLVEAEYGNTMEIYPEEIVLDDQKIQVNVFRLGRISLFFQTLDGKTSGYFDPATFEWKVFSPEYSRQIRAAIEMGAKQRPLDLVVLPIGRLVRE